MELKSAAVGTVVSVVLFTACASCAQEPTESPQSEPVRDAEELSLEDTCSGVGDLLSEFGNTMLKFRAGQLTDEGFAEFEADLGLKWTSLAEKGSGEVEEALDDASRAAMMGDLETNHGLDEALEVVSDHCEAAGYPIMLHLDGG